MITHWGQRWIALQHGNELVVLHGEEGSSTIHAMMELHITQESNGTESTVLTPEIQNLLDQFSEVFDTPAGLPPRRRYDHHIPLIPGARPVSMRPYRVAPELKS